MTNPLADAVLARMGDRTDSRCAAEAGLSRRAVVRARGGRLPCSEVHRIALASWLGVDVPRLIELSGRAAPERSALGQQIRERRGTMTQQDLADLLGVNRVTVARWETRGAISQEHLAQVRAWLAS